MISGSVLESVFDDFPCFWHHFFDHEICIDLSLIWVWILVSCLIDLWCISRSCTHLEQPSKTITLTMNLHGFTHRKNRNFHVFPHVFRYPFVYWFLMSFGIDVGSIWGAFLCYFPCCFKIVPLLSVALKGSYSVSKGGAMHPHPRWFPHLRTTDSPVKMPFQNSLFTFPFSKFPYLSVR